MQLDNISLQKEKILSVQNLTVKLENKTILKNINLDMSRGEILGIIGPSGSGKSILMRAILGLIPRFSGEVKVLGKNLNLSTNKKDNTINTKFGVLFQHGALFSSMTVQENISIPIREHLNLPEELINDIVQNKMSMVGLPIEVADVLPSQLSGGMIKRVSLARSLAIDPDLIFLDEPTSGLDPIGTSEFDNLLIKLHHLLGLSVYMITHDLDSLVSTCSRVIVLKKKGILKEGTISDILNSNDPWIRSYFSRFTKEPK
ncbi:putative ATP-binding component of ABC transporter [Candidatus Liberibacter solanacearum CLso-ZC1]|uniref:Putative ATP-binding component of ABC transporter n=1 Tax=Liberibacter solanacearum (strain CLso-ZC1) TaxID=658172 RepID=E4UDR4_LIBSC|nr:ATP-binding cassette domain-containing protein [Candidatus Liberibacter solanacearum]ADR52742.1 putative ATP-binding component of ABC transporter [Candidatus Liberibacter solanacearum CLso-ZC1]